MTMWHKPDKHWESGALRRFKACERSRCCSAATTAATAYAGTVAVRACTDLRQGMSPTRVLSD
eukprot:529400-Rhodomonas_salina.2